MRIKYTNHNDEAVSVELTDKALTVGRSPDADIVILDERSSRMHCGIRLWDGDYYVKDLQSRNGTFLNNEKVEMAKIKSGDKIVIGKCQLIVEDENTPGPETLLHNVEEAMDEGKGYDTILKEIVEDVEESEAPPAPAAPPKARKAIKMVKKGGLTAASTDENPKPKMTIDGASDSDAPKKIPTIIKKKPGSIKFNKPNKD